MAFKGKGEHGSLFPLIEFEGERLDVSEPFSVLFIILRRVGARLRRLGRLLLPLGVADPKDTLLKAFQFGSGLELGLGRTLCSKPFGTWDGLRRRFDLV